MNHIIKADILEICNEIKEWSELKSKKFFITGARGYFASYIVYVLLFLNDLFNLNITVYALCRDKGKSEKFYYDFLKREDFKLVIQDVIETIDDKYKSDIIIHAASIGNYYMQDKYPYQVIQGNLMGLSNLLKKSEEWKSEKLLFFSSCVVYGNSQQKYVEDNFCYESLDFVDYKNAYALSKRMGEMMLAAKRKEGFKTHVNVLRPISIYGPGERYSEKKPFTDFLGDYLCSRDIELESNGKKIRSYLYIKDAVKAFFFILQYGKSGQAYNVSSNKNIYSIKELASMFTKYNKKISLKIKSRDREYFKSGDDIMIAENKKIQLLGWNEETKLRDGIMRTILWAEKSDFMDQ